MQIGFLIGRVVFGLYLLFSGFSGLANAGALAGYAASKGVPAAGLAVVVSHLLLLIAGFCFISGWRPQWGVAALVIFLIPVTFSMHAFWTEEAPAARMAQMINFTKNAALAGASLMFLAIPRPWAYSLEGRHVSPPRTALHA
jgi:putative oxidoreductase